MDSLEAINSDRIAVIVGYISDYVDYLIVAAFPEDTEGLDSEYENMVDILYINRHCCPA